MPIKLRWYKFYKIILHLSTCWMISSRVQLQVAMRKSPSGGNMSEMVDK